MMDDLADNQDKVSQSEDGTSSESIGKSGWVMSRALWGDGWATDSEDGMEFTPVEEDDILAPLGAWQAVELLLEELHDAAEIEPGPERSEKVRKTMMGIVKEVMELLLQLKGNSQKATTETDFKELIERCQKQTITEVSPTGEIIAPMVEIIAGESMAKLEISEDLKNSAALDNDSIKIQK